MKHHRVLIVEDESIVQLHLRRSLEAVGFEVVATASTASEAIAAADAACPDLVLMDIELAGERDGVEAALEIRSRHDVALVFLTAYADDNMLTRTAEVGAEGYVVKPFGNEELKAALLTAISSREQGRISSSRQGRRERPHRDPSSGPRLMIYSHDTFGLGHLRRSLNLAQELVETFHDLSVLIVTGSAAAHRYELPPRVDYVKLPAVRKVAPETYEARSLDVDEASILAFRENMLLSVAMDFDPDVLLVDHSPVGMSGELLRTLEWLGATRPSCTKILGLRDIIDDPAAVVSHWQREGVYRVIEEIYDHVLVYGNQRVFDTVKHYGLSGVSADKIAFVNYVVERDGDTVVRGPGTHDRHIVVTTGGGDGAVDLVAGTFLDMIRLNGERLSISGTILTGPFADDATVEALGQRSRDLPVEVHQFVDSTVPYMKGADLVICTGGYNTLFQAVRHATRILVIPRTLYRREQLLRAETLQALGMVQSMTPDEVTPRSLLQRVAKLFSDDAQLPELRDKLAFDGAAGAARFLRTHALLERQTQETANE